MASPFTRSGWFLAGLILASIGDTPARAADARPPNVLIFIADDMGFSDSGCYGGEIETPNLDRLAANGLRFTQCYSTARCWPSRSSIMTGYYAQQIHADPPDGKLPSWARVLPHYLKPRGYRSYHAGKWHVPGAPRPVEDGGFDDSYGGIDQNNHFKSRRPAGGSPAGGQDGSYSTVAIADEAIRQLREHARAHADRPFFSYVAFIAPHFPIQAPAEDIARHLDRYREGWDVIRERRWRRLRDLGLVDCALPPLDAETVPGWNLSPAALRDRVGPGEAAHAVPWARLTPDQKAFQPVKMAIHAAMVDRIDREIGRVLDQVKAMGAWEQTVIFFVSDNGASAEIIIRGGGHDPSAPPGSEKTFLCLGPGWSSASNAPFRLHKSWVHEGGTSSPLIVHWSSGIRAKGELRHAPNHFVDVVPTVLELAGAAASAARGADAPPFPGRSLVPAFAADVPLPREPLFFHHLDNRAIRVGDWKLVSKGKGGPWELYDLASDRSETKDLADRHPEKVRDLAARWQQLEETFRRQAGPGERKKAK